MATITRRGTKWQIKIRRKGQPGLSATFASEEASTPVKNNPALQCDERWILRAVRYG